MRATTTTYEVRGMTCGHCVNAVTEELTGVPGVREVEIDLEAGGTSRVRVVSEQPLDVETVRAAVDEAGYELARARTPTRESSTWPSAG
jgi:copper chaperone CopZ